jgi:lipopolysaccharide/colanic/teichoic acid biosynthesis glycosyltransferase
VEDRERSASAFGLGEPIDANNSPRAVPVVHEQGMYEKAAKPVTDRIAGVILSILTFPLIVILVPLNWAILGRPAIYKQVRIGRFGREFTVYKLRTMESDRRDSSSPIGHTDRRVNHKSTSDPRHTSVGRFLRKWSLDEIPQFWNLAIGDMSLVGPRPELPEIVNKYEPWQHRRHEVRPGITGLWQVSARGDAPMHEATDIDIDYVEEIGLVEDLRIVLSTPQAVLGSKKGH